METDKVIDSILYVFGAEDGGVSFAHMRAFLHGLEEKAKEGDKASEALLDIARKFARLCDLARTGFKGPKKKGG